MGQFFSVFLTSPIVFRDDLFIRKIICQSFCAFGGIMDITVWLTSLLTHILSQIGVPSWLTAPLVHEAITEGCKDTLKIQAHLKELASSELIKAIAAEAGKNDKLSVITEEVLTALEQLLGFTPAK